MRIILDTNPPIRAILPSQSTTRAVAIIFDAATANHFTLLPPPELFEELTNKLANRPYVAARVSADKRAAFLGLLTAVATLLPPYVGPIPAVVRDAKDDFLLAYAERDRADYLVTDDQDLIALREQTFPFQIVSFVEFLHTLRRAGLV